MDFLSTSSLDICSARTFFKSYSFLLRSSVQITSPPIMFEVLSPTAFVIWATRFPTAALGTLLAAQIGLISLQFTLSDV